MKIVNISGGLGNQMFQYAFALKLQSLYSKEDVLIDIQHYHSVFFKNFRGVNLHNGFELYEIFNNASLKIARPKDIFKISYYIPNYILSRIVRRVFPKRRYEYVAKYSTNYSYDLQAINKKFDCYYEGYWQCVKYFLDIKDKLMYEFQHPKPNEYNQRLISEISSCLSVGIHVRRGDYLHEPEFKGICDIEYYKRAIYLLTSESQQYEFFVFSNDLQWCKDNLSPFVGHNKVHFVSENQGSSSCWDMFLMSYCKYLIIANSSFSWWGAFLNRSAEKIFCPYPWINRDCDIDIYDPSWIKIGKE